MYSVASFFIWCTKLNCQYSGKNFCKNKNFQSISLQLKKPIKWSQKHDFMDHLESVSCMVIFTVKFGEKTRLELMISSLGAVYKVTQWPAGFLAIILLMPPAWYVSYSLITDGMTCCSNPICKYKIYTTSITCTW